MDQISIDTTWQVVSGEHDSHKSALQVNEERTSSGAFVDASFYGDFDLGATVSGSPTTVVVFGVRAFDVAGNSDACVFYMGIVPEEGKRAESVAAQTSSNADWVDTGTAVPYVLAASGQMCCIVKIAQEL